MSALSRPRLPFTSLRAEGQGAAPGASRNNLLVHSPRCASPAQTTQPVDVRIRSRKGASQLPQAALEINAPDVVHEVIDGEAIMINMTTGSYYSLDGVGAAVWEIPPAGSGELGLHRRHPPAGL